MPRSPDGPVSATGRHRESDELTHLKAAHWRNQHEIHALRDTMAVYRDAITEMARENFELRDELARSRTLCTRRERLGAQQTFELSIGCDEFAPDVVSLAVGEALEDMQSAELVAAWQLIAFELTGETIRTEALSSEAMLILRMNHSPRAVGVEVLALDCA